MGYPGSVSSGVTSRLGAILVELAVIKAAFARPIIVRPPWEVPRAHKLLIPHITASEDRSRCAISGE